MHDLAHSLAHASAHLESVGFPLEKDLGSIRLVAIDLDGTLLRRDGTPSFRSRRIVRELSRKDVRVVIATGRPSTAAIRISRWLGASSPAISCNGAHIVAGEVGKYDQEIRFAPIKPEILPALIEILRRFGVYFHIHFRGCYGIERQYLRRSPKKVPSLRRIWFSLLGATAASPVMILEDGVSGTYAGKVPKVCVDGRREEILEVKSALSSTFRGEIQTVMTGPTFMEILDARVNKGEALGLVGEILGVSPDEMAALGDGDNDVEMLKVAGVGVAMANASPSLSLVADRFTYSCDEDGVAEFLEEVLRRQKERTRLY